jgi:glycosyltransferase involved in cell wall biosynthesis
MLINIVTVVFNDANYLEETIRSVIHQKQTRTDLSIKYFVVDGGSTDGTLKLLDEYGDSVDKWISEADRGIYDAMNKGLQMVDDGYVLFLGAGDKVISLLDAQLLKEDKIKVFYGNVWKGDELFVSNLDRKLRSGNTLHHQALLVHKSLFPASGFNIKYRAYADYDLNAKLFMNGVEFIKINELIGFQMPGGLTTKIHIREALDIIKKYFGLMEFCIALFRSVASEIKSRLLRKESILWWGKFD